MEFPLDLAKDFLKLQSSYFIACSDVMDERREYQNTLANDGVISADPHHFYMADNLVDNTDPSKLGNNAKIHREQLKRKLETMTVICDSLSSHEFMPWINSTNPLQRAIEKHHKKMFSRRKYYSGNQYETYQYLSGILTMIVRYYERQINSDNIEGYVLNKKKRKLILDTGNKLLSELQDLPAIVNERTQEEILIYLQRFINELNCAETSGLAVARAHPKVNREIFIKEIIGWYSYQHDIVPADVINEIVSIIDPDITERKIYAIISSAKPALYRIGDEYYPDEEPY